MRFCITNIPISPISHENSTFQAAKDRQVADDDPIDPVEGAVENGPRGSQVTAPTGNRVDHW